jgi:hypothetical protein
MPWKHGRPSGLPGLQKHTAKEKPQQHQMADESLVGELVGKLWAFPRDTDDFSEIDALITDQVHACSVCSVVKPLNMGGSACDRVWVTWQPY